MSELVLLRPDAISGLESRLRAVIDAPHAHAHGRYSTNEILDFAKRGIWQLWIAEDLGEILFVGATEIIAYSGLRALVIKFVVGRDRKRWQHHLGTVLEWGKLEGCTIAEGVFRKGWRRVLPGWNHSHDYLQRAL